jgi:2-(3-amino-3-carboxypropyl)histidine synthase
VEGYDIEAMKSCREKAISTARGASSFGLIMGTLGHQGSILVLKELKKQIEAAGKTCVVVLLSEITPEKLKMFSDIKA